MTSSTLHLHSPSPSSTSTSTPSTTMKTIIAFFTMGLLNNISYVVMLGCAKSISEGGTALVFLANIMPGFLLKLTSPYWFDKVSYYKRILVGSLLMMMSFLFVSVFSYLKDVSSSSNNYNSDQNNNNDNDSQKEGGGASFYVLMQLLGVAFCSAQGDLGEASLLALSGKVESLLAANQNNNVNIINNYNHNNIIIQNQEYGDNEKEEEEQEEQDEEIKKKKSLCITAFASGTGLAGPLGFAYVVFTTKVLGLPLPMALMLALVFPISYLTVFHKYLLKFTFDGEHNDIGTGSDGCSRSDNDDEVTAFLHQSSNNENRADRKNNNGDDQFHDHDTTSLEMSNISFNYEIDENIESTMNVSKTKSSTNNNQDISKMSFRQRLNLTLSLWPYMIPLFTVYWAEYALQSGVWTAIGFPVESKTARNTFYTNSNWAYQIGVFISRSSGAFCIAPMWVLWLMPFLQVVNLVLFYSIATYQFWYTNWLLIPSFYVGLLGGSVYVNGYMRINRDLPLGIREFALSTVSVADSLGIVFADISGLFIQSCLYKSNNIGGAVVTCPI